MNDNDKNNLEFLLAVGHETLTDWWEQSSEDDRLYAAELLEEYSQILIEKELRLMHEYHDAIRVIDKLK